MDLENYAQLGRCVCIAFISLIVWTLLRLVYDFYILPFFRSYSWSVNCNSWAIITGATDGIGYEFAHQLAQKGYNLCLISRNFAKLEKTQKSILLECPSCSIELVTFDFTSKDYRPLEEAINKLPQIDILVNNVGILPVDDHYGHWFLEIDPKMIEATINVNILSCLKMSHLILPIMERQKTGLIINVSSISGRKPTPLLQFYGASKTLIDYFSRALAFEYKEKGITIQSLIPCYIRTNMAPLKPGLFVPSAKDYVRSALKIVGLSKRSTGFFAHEMSFLPVIFESFVSLWQNAIDRIGTKYIASKIKKKDSHLIEPSKQFPNDFSSILAYLCDPFKF